MKLTGRGRRISMMESNRRSRAAKKSALKRRGRPRKKISIRRSIIKRRRNAKKGINRYGKKLSVLKSRGYRPRQRIKRRY